MEISVLSTLNALVEVIDPAVNCEQDTYLGFAVRSEDVPSLVQDIEKLVHQKYAGLTYADLVDEDTAALALANHVAKAAC